MQKHRLALIAGFRTATVQFDYYKTV